MVGFERLFGDDRSSKGSHLSIAESDSAIGNAADPGRSLRHTKLAAHTCSARRRRAGRGEKSKDDDHGKSESELEAELAAG